ncbi:MAG TPA: helix-turn-helix domain-containing protein [Epulopiscium sp.]|nr:helix-turn-helix domain-containing protein [Candidatus Epulonipiscium sp.]
MNINNDLTITLFNHRENDFLHSSYDKELNFYAAVQSGNLEAVSQYMTPLTSEGLGKLSSHPIRNLQYHLVVTIALLTRFCMEGGLNQETAYSLSDLFIQRADTCTSIKEITNLHRNVIFEYTKKMGELVKNKLISKPVVICLDYIYKNYHNTITLKELASHVNLNPTYLSSLFKREMDIPLGKYIQIKKVEAIMNMLKYSDLPYTDISNYFSYSSHSHFIATFKKYTGMTPRQYRNKYYCSNWK